MSTLELRRPCGVCGAVAGTSQVRNGQDVAYCTQGHYCYCRPKAESGTARRSVRTRPSLKPSVRYRVLERDGHRCVSCGRSAPDVILDVDHFLPVGHPLASDLDESMLWDESNLLTLCEQCNLGKSDSLPALPSVFAAILRHYRSAP